MIHTIIERSQHCVTFKRYDNITYSPVDGWQQCSRHSTSLCIFVFLECWNYELSLWVANEGRAGSVRGRALITYVWSEIREVEKSNPPLSLIIIAEARQMQKWCATQKCHSPGAWGTKIYRTPRAVSRAGSHLMESCMLRIGRNHIKAFIQRFAY